MRWEGEAALRAVAGHPLVDLDSNLDVAMPGTIFDWSAGAPGRFYRWSRAGRSPRAIRPLHPPAVSKRFRFRFRSQSDGGEAVSRKQVFQT